MPAEPIIHQVPNFLERNLLLDQYPGMLVLVDYDPLYPDARPDDPASNPTGRVYRLRPLAECDLHVNAYGNDNNHWELVPDSADGSGGSDAPVLAQGRMMRDLTGFNTLGNSVPGRDFASGRAALLELLYPYTAPNFVFDGSGTQQLPVGSLNDVVLSLHSISAGTNELVEKRISALADNGAPAVLALVVPPTGQSTVDTSSLSVPVLGLTRPTAGERRFRATVRNGRTGPLGNDVVSKELYYEFRYQVAFGFTKTDPRTLSEAQLSDLIFGAGSTFGRNLGGTSQRLAGSPDSDYAVLVLPALLGSLSYITQNGYPDPLLGIFDILAKNLTCTQPPNTPTAASYAGVPHLLYVQKAVSGTGAPAYFDFG